VDKLYHHPPPKLPWLCRSSCGNSFSQQVYGNCVGRDVTLDIQPIQVIITPIYRPAERHRRLRLMGGSVSDAGNGGSRAAARAISVMCHRFAKWLIRREDSRRHGRRRRDATPQFVALNLSATDKTYDWDWIGTVVQGEQQTLVFLRVQFRQISDQATIHAHGLLAHGFRQPEEISWNSQLRRVHQRRRWREEDKTYDARGSTDEGLTCLSRSITTEKSRAAARREIHSDRIVENMPTLISGFRENFIFFWCRNVASWTICLSAVWATFNCAAHEHHFTTIFQQQKCLSDILLMKRSLSK